MLRVFKRLSQSLILCCVLISIAATARGAIVVQDLDDIVLWTGAGANRAALVIDWADGTDPLVWGYRFDTATGADMLQAVVEADSRLFAKVQPFSFGWFTHGLGYDRAVQDFAITSGTDFGSNGFVFDSSFADAMAVASQDSYRETDENFAQTWGYWLGEGATYPAAAGWAESQVGVSDRVLGNEAWDGFRFNTPGVPPATAFAAVPEPSTGAVCVGILAMTAMRRRRAATRC